MELQLEALLKDIRLAMPHLDLSSFPKLFPDPRIRTQNAFLAEKKGPGSFGYRIHIVTKDKPVRILTNLASAPVPIRMDVSLDSEKPPLGTIHLDSFPIDLFHRSATVERFDLGLEPEKQTIAGSLKVEYTDYTVKAILKGTVADPVYRFVSEPALSEQEALSVFLFGKTSDSLDSDQAQSVGNVRTAVANRGLDLASLYLLSATPIESVGYDPATGAFSAKVKIASGTSLNVSAGGQSEYQAVGIRKRLGNNFSITTEVTTGDLDRSGSLAGTTAETGQRNVSALLEWRHRY
jgi:hypothetical protein